MAGETPADHHQDPQTPRPINLPGRLRSAQKNPPHGSQRGHLLVAACHRQSAAAAHPPARLPKAQWLLKESCTVEPNMDGAAGEEGNAALRVTFDPRLKLEFHGSKVTSDAGLLPFRDLDDALGLTALAGDVLAETRTGQNSRHTLIAQLRQAVFGRLAGYEDVNDADRLAHDPALRWIIGGRAVAQTAASTSGSVAVGSGMVVRRSSCPEVPHVAPPERSPSPAHGG